MRLTWTGLDFILRSIKSQSSPTIEELIKKEFLVDKARIQADMGVVKKRTVEEYEGIRLKQDFIRNAVFRQNNWEFCPLAMKKGEIPIGLYGIVTGK